MNKPRQVKLKDRKHACIYLSISLSTLDEIFYEIALECLYFNAFIRLYQLPNFEMD